MITEGKLHTEKSIDIINTMHKAISNTFKEKKRKSYEYVGDFLLTISMALAAMEFFPYHIIWEFVSEKNSAEKTINEKVYLRDVTDDGYKNPPEGDRKTFFKKKINEYWELPFNKNDFFSRAKRAVRNNQLTTIFDLPIREEYSYFNLPVFSWVEGEEDKSEPNWVITAIYRSNDNKKFESDSSFKFMKFFSDQISLSWKKFWESSAQKVHIKIDGEIDNFKKDEPPTVEKELEITTKVLAEEFRSELCALFLFNEQKNILQMEFDNIGISQKLRYQLNRDSNIIIECFKENKVFRISDRDQIVQGMNLDSILKPIEEKGPIKHCLCVPINSGKTKVGVIVLLRPTPPYTEFVTNMLINILSQLSDVVLSYFTIQRREKDLRNIIDQITAPVKALVGHVEELQKKRIPRELGGKLAYISKLSRIALKYANNFEKMLEFDSGSIEPKKEKLFDLRDYLIGFAIEYQPLIRSKCIHINVTEKTITGIDFYVDKDLFYRAIANIIDNAIKYSFSPEEREILGFQPKPGSRNDLENILISAEEKGDQIVICISSLGLEILKEERDRIFGKEFRGVKAIERYPVGTGIGLYISKKIIDCHNGTLEIAPGENPYNTIFQITLPKE